MKIFLTILSIFLVTVPLFGQEAFEKKLLDNLLINSKNEENLNAIVYRLERKITPEDAVLIISFLADNSNAIESESINQIIRGFNNETHSFASNQILDCLFLNYSKFKKDTQVIIFHLTLQLEQEKTETSFNQFIHAYGKDLLYLSPFLVRHKLHTPKETSKVLFSFMANENIKYSIYQIYREYLKSKSIDSDDLPGLQQTLFDDLNHNIDHLKTHQKRSEANIILLLEIATFAHFKLEEKMIQKILSFDTSEVTIKLIELIFRQNKNAPLATTKRLLESEIFRIKFLKLCEKYQKHTNLLKPYRNQETIARAGLINWFNENYGLNVSTKDITLAGFFKIEHNASDKMALFKCTLQFPFIKEKIVVAASGGIFRYEEDLNFSGHENIGSNFVLWDAQKAISHVENLIFLQTTEKNSLSNFEIESDDQNISETLNLLDSLLILNQINLIMKEAYNRKGNCQEENGKLFESIFDDESLALTKFSLTKKTNTYLRNGKFSFIKPPFDIIISGEFSEDVLQNKFEIDFHSEKVIVSLDHGEITSIQFYARGILRATIPISNQLINGALNVFDDAGDIILEHNYQMGVRHGKHLEYFAKGKIKRSGNFNNGQPLGETSRYDIDGNLLSKIQWRKNGQGKYQTYYPNGKLSSKGSFKNQRLSGLKEEFYESGELRGHFHYLDGQINGLTRVWFENGKMKSQTNYKNGVRQGEEKHFYESGKIKIILNYDDDLIAGETLSYDEKGTLRNKAFFKKNEADGECIQYNKNSKIIATAQYEKGKLKNGTSFNDNTYELLEFKNFIRTKRSLCDADGNILKEAELYDERLIEVLKKNIETRTTNQILQIEEYHPTILNFDLGYGQNSLHLACMTDIENTDLITLLMELKVDINKQDVFGNTPMHYALQNNNKSFIEKLLLKGARIDIQNHKGILLSEEILKNEKMVTFSIKNSAKISKTVLQSRDQNWYLALENGDTDALMSMAQNGIEWNSAKGNNILVHCVSKGHYKVVEFVLNSKDFIYTDVIQEDLLQFTNSDDDKNMIALLKRTPAQTQYIDPLGVELNSIYVTKSKNKKIKHGRFKKFNPDGELIMSGTYQNNLLEGLLYEITDGFLFYKKYSLTPYSKGVMDGVKITYFRYHGNFNPNDPIQITSTYKNNLLNGVTCIFETPDQKILEINFENGVKNGICKEWQNENELISDLIYKDGKIWSGFTILNINEDIIDKQFDINDFKQNTQQQQIGMRWEFENGNFVKKVEVPFAKNYANSINFGLAWLASIQEENGSWDPEKFEGKSSDQMKLLCSATSLLSFLGYGYTDRAGKHKHVVKKALKWLIDQQLPDGSFTNDNSINGLCTQALVEATSMGCGDATTKTVAINACKFLLAQQNASGGFNTFGHSDKTEHGDQDKMQPTVFCIMALNASLIEGILEKEIKECFIKCDQLFNKVPTTGDIGENSKGHGWLHAGGELKDSTNGAIHQAMAVRVRQSLKHHREEPWLKVATKEISQNLPQDIHTINYVLGYFQSATLSEQGGDAYNHWGTPFFQLLINAQSEDGKFKNSWPTTHSTPFADGGRIVSTAFAILSLEIRHRLFSDF